MTAVLIPAAHRSLASRLRWALADAWTITGRELLHWANQPVQLVTNLLFSVMVLLMFAFLFGGAMAVPGGGDYRTFLVPGVLALTVVFGVEATFTAISTDVNRGITDRFRSLPMAPSAVVLGRGLADLLGSVLTLAAPAVAGLAIGWRWADGTDAAVAFGLLLLLRLAMLWVGIYLGLVLRNPEAVMALQILVWPVGFLSSAFVSPSSMPSWLGFLAEWNPLSATADATRELFGDPAWGGDTWTAEHPLLMAVVWPVLLIAVFFPLAVRRYRRLGR